MQSARHGQSLKSVCYVQPCLVLPTALAIDDSVSKAGHKHTNLEDLHYFIGQEALDLTLTHTIQYPIRQGVVRQRR